MDLPSEFDVIVLGTVAHKLNADSIKFDVSLVGMPESIVAAAFARIGQSVLHLDKNEYYSGDWASFNLQGIQRWIEQHKADATETNNLPRPSVDEKAVLEEGERLLEMPLDRSSFANAEACFYVSEEDGGDVSETAAATNNTDELDKIPEATGKTEERMGGEIDKELKPASDQDSCSNIQSSETVEGGIETVSNSSKKDEDIKENVLEDNKAVGIDQADENAEKEKEVAGRESADETRQPSEESAGASEMGGEQSKSSDVKDTGTKPLKWTAKKINEEWRRFNLDLSPKVLYSVGEMVSLLIESDIAKYCEFKTVTQILTVLNGKIEKVPCSRADVFSSKTVSMLEKRMLMKFIQFCLDFENKQEEIQDTLEKPFVEFLASRKLTPTVQHYIQHSIAMATDSMTARQGLEQMKKFLSSLGRYGNTAFLWSLYGSGELPQSFCRMCAVFGGTYCLKMTASALILDKENKCSGIITTEGQKIKCKWLIMESSYAPDVFLAPCNKRTISRAILMCDRSLLTTDQQEQLSLMCLPCPDDGDRPIYILQLPPSSMASPQGIYICHLTRRGGEGTPAEDLSYAMDQLFTTDTSSESDKPRVLWMIYFSQEDRSEVQASDSVPSNVLLVSGPGLEIDIDRPVTEGREIFKKILPDEEFLPKAPNPEDIIYVDDTEAQVANSDGQSEFAEQVTDQSENVTTGNQPLEPGSSQSDSKGAHTDQSEIKTDGSKTHQFDIETSQPDTVQCTS